MEQRVDDFETIYEIPFTKFEEEWKGYLGNIKVTQNIDWVLLMKRGCG